MKRKRIVSLLMSVLLGLGIVFQGNGNIVKAEEISIQDALLADSSVESTVSKIASFAGNKNWEDATVAYGDLNEANDGLDKNAELTVNINGQNVRPYMSTSTNYYQGGVGICAGDYVQIKFSTLGYGNTNINCRMRGSATAAKTYTIQYSTDGINFLNNGEITLSKKATYEDISFSLPSEVNNCESVYVRLVAGNTNFNGSLPASGGTFRIQNLEIKGNQIEQSDTCSTVKIMEGSTELPLGSSLTMTTETADAKIYYSLNNEEFKLYDSNNKPVVDKLPVTVTAYAAKEGFKDSTKTTCNFTQAKVNNVYGSPNGGSVKLNSKIKLTCSTENAEILYSYDNVTWNEYTEEITLDKLPINIYTKAVSAGCIDSDVSTLSFEERANEEYNIYFGQLHSHSNYSDGAGTCEEAFKYAAENAENTDFLAVTDHSNSFDNASQGSIADGSVSEEWKEGHELAKKYTSDDFVGIYGYEMTWSNGLGHMNTFNTAGFQSRTQTQYSNYSTALQNYYDTLKTSPNSISQFNHPGTTFGDFDDFNNYDREIDNLVTLIEVGNGEGAIGSSGYFRSYDYYTRALDKGWHVAPTNNQDNHKRLWGDANTARTVILADKLNEENIYDALRNYRVYASEDNDLNIYYTLNGNVMGSILGDEAKEGKDTVEISADISDNTDSEIGKVEVITNGGLVLDSKNLDTKSDKVNFNVSSNYSYYYLRITQKDGDIAVTAPVWVGEADVAGISSFSTKEILPVTGKPIDLSLDLFNNESSDLLIDSIEFSVNGEVVHKADLAAAGLNKIESKKTGSYTWQYTSDKASEVTVNAKVTASLNGVEKVFDDVLKINFNSPKMIKNVIIDGTHNNDYVSGYYSGNMNNFANIAAGSNIKTIVEKDKITKEMLEDCELLVISAPAKKAGTANGSSYDVAYFDDDYINLVKEFVNKGGNVVICGIADYQDTTNSQTTVQINKLLKAIGSTMTLNSDELYDEVNNGGQPYRLYFNKFNLESKYLKGVSNTQTYSAYSACSVNLGSNEETDLVYPADWLVKGHDTTYSINSKDENGAKLDGTEVVVNKGDVIALASQETKAGGTILLAGTVFVSDFEVKTDNESTTAEPYANRVILDNVFSSIKAQTEVTPIGEARKGNKGDVFTVEGYVTSGTEKEGCTFFDTIYLQDSTGGITIYPYSESGLEIGTKVRVTGYIDEYQGDKEIQLTSYEIIDEPKVVINPSELSNKDAMDYDNYGGILAKISGVVEEVLYTDDGKGVSQFRIKDENGDIATVFIDGYIYSSITGKNELASTIKKGNKVSAVGLVYRHPEGGLDKSIACLRVRDCEEIKLISSVNTLEIQDLNTGSKNHILFGETVELSGQATGNGDLEYRFVAVNGAYKEVIQDFSSNNKISWTPKLPGDYNIYLVVKDKEGKTVQKVIRSFKVKDKDFNISNFEINKESTKIGEEATLKVAATGEGIEYRFVAVSGEYKEVIQDFNENAEVKWTPSKAGFYNMYVVCKNQYGQTVRKVIKRFRVSVEDLKVDSFEINKESTKIGEEATLKAAATGEGIEYRFVAVSGEYKEVIQDFSENAEVNWVPSKAGKYNIYAVCKDESGKTLQKVVKNYNVD